MSPTLPTGREVLSPEQESLLKARFATLSANLDALNAPDQVEAALMTAFAKHHRQRKAHIRRQGFLGQWFAPGFALMASVTMSAWMLFAPGTQLAQPPAPSNTYASATNDAPFIALLSLEQIEREPNPRLVQAPVPKMWLASYGIPVSPETAGDSVRAEMLVSANGQPLAMRFVP